MHTASAAGFVRPESNISTMTAAIFLGLAAIAVAAPSHAEDRLNGHWYVAGAVNGSNLRKPDQTIANAPAPGLTLNVTNDVDFGWGGQIEVGRSMGALRLEAEVGRVDNKSKAYSATSPIQITLPQKGKNAVTRYMANVYYDVPQGALPVRLYFGAGLGAADSHVTTFAAPARAPMAPPSQLLDIRQTVLAYQFIGGLSRDLTDHLALTAQYRWFDAGTIKGHDARGERATRDLAGSNIDLGLRYRF